MSDCPKESPRPEINHPNPLSQIEKDELLDFLTRRPLEFKNINLPVRPRLVLDPCWNMGLIQQVIGRCVRKSDQSETKNSGENLTNKSNDSSELQKLLDLLSSPPPESGKELSTILAELQPEMRISENSHSIIFGPESKKLSKRQEKRRKKDSWKR